MRQIWRWSMRYSKCVTTLGSRCLTPVYEPVSHLVVRPRGCISHQTAHDL